MKPPLILFLSILASCSVDKRQNSDLEVLNSSDTIRQLETTLLKDSIGQDSLIKEKTNELIGTWQDSPEIASGYTDHYEFFEDGSFMFNYNEMICDKRSINYSGTWELISNDLKLTIKKETVIIGGKLVSTGEAGSCASDYYIEGGERKTKDLPEFKHQAIVISSITIDTEKRDLKTRMFDNHRFWKIEEPTPQEDEN